MGLGRARIGLARQEWLGMAGIAVDRTGAAGVARNGVNRIGKARQEWPGKARPVTARTGTAGKARCGAVRCV